MKKAVIILPTKDHNEDLFNCLRSLNESIDAKSWNVKVIIVDDHSSKAMREEQITNFIKFSICKNLTVKLMFMERSIGFIKCCNAALKTVLQEKKLPEYIGFLHDDVEVMKNWIDRLAKELESDIDAYCATSMSSSTYDVHSIFSLNLKEISSVDISKEDFSPLVESVIKDDMTFEDDKFQMFATLFKTESFTKYGIFDDDNLTSINMEYEYAKRLKENRRTIKIVPKACVFHKTRMLSDENPNQLTYSKAVKATQWINEVNQEFTQKKYAIYTYVRENETLPIVPEFDDSIEYVCFTSNSALYAKRGQHHPWKIFKVDDVADFFKFPKDSIKMKEFIKMNPHLLLKKASISIWIDSNIEVLKDITELSRLMNKDNFLLALDDQRFDCLYRKLIDVKNTAYMTSSEFDSILQIYKWCRYPQNNGLMNTSLLIRKHNDERCKAAMNKTWNFIQNTYANDMLFLNFVLWLNKNSYSYVPENIVIGNYINFKENN